MRSLPGTSTLKYARATSLCGVAAALRLLSFFIITYSSVGANFPSRLNRLVERGSSNLLLLTIPQLNRLIDYEVILVAKAMSVLLAY